MGRHLPVFDPLVVVVCDSVGCGLAPDAAEFGDLGANTLAHVIEAESPALPNLAALGLDRINGVPALTASPNEARAAHGRLIEQGPAKDTMVGHWELMGVVAERPPPLYPEGFPVAVVDAFRAATGTEVLGNFKASGTAVLDDLGAEHLRSGNPILYTSGDSVFQLAAHERVLPVEELYALCAQARRLLTGEHGVGRVIARPFTGAGPGAFVRLSSQRRDYALPPPRCTALDYLSQAGVGTRAIGKINDVFGGRGIDAFEKTADNASGIEAIRRCLAEPREPFVLANLLDFDSLFGHRNDVAGYAMALQQLDRAIPAWLESLPVDGMLMLTADHGNDPTWPGTDHTRECAPLLAIGDHVRSGSLGSHAFADLGATILENFRVDAPSDGVSFLDDLS